jgi:acetolactate synthase I/III small subunit
MPVTLSIHLEDTPGSLDRVASLVRRRAFNIMSLTVGASERAGVSRMTLVVDADEDGARRIEANLYKLLNVLHVENISRAPSIVRDLALVRVAANQHTRASIVQLAEVFRARIVDVAPDSLVIEITGTEDKVDGLVEVLRPFGVLELARTGRIAIARGARVAERRDATAALPPPPAFEHTDISYSV